MLDEVRERMESSNVVLDASLPAAYVDRIRERFGSSVLLVGFRINEEEWRRRDTSRHDRGALEFWNAQLTALQGAEDLRRNLRGA
jgi:chloramphenicol 3-O-phosphotransferase